MDTATRPPFSEAVTGELRAEMAKRRITSDKLAETLGTHRDWVHRRLNGQTRLNLDDLTSMCEALDLDPRELLMRAAS